MIKGASVVLIVVAVVVLVAGPAQAQQAATGSIIGRVVDSDGGVVPGASVVVGSAQGSTTLLTDAGGRFVASLLPPGRYSVRVEREGLQSVERPNIEVGLGRRVELELVLRPGTFTGTLEVTAASPMIDLSTASAAIAISSARLEQIPVGRQLSDTLYLAPGVTGSGGAGRPNPSISGASGLENSYVVDGVDITNQRYGALGVYSSGYGSFGAGVTYDFVEEVQIRGAGAEAEFDQSTGGVVNVVTRSGGNELHGSAFAYLRPVSWEGSRRLVALDNGAVNTTGEEQRELGFSLGGPIVHDRAFFFVAGSEQRERTTFLAPEGFPLYDLGGVDRERRVLAYAAKGTLLVATGHRLEASLFGDPGRGDTGPQSADTMRFRDTGAFSGLDYGTDNQALAYYGVIGGRAAVEATLGRSASALTESPGIDEWMVTDETVTPTLIYGGKGRYEKTNDGENLQLRAKATHVVGAHEIGYGLAYDDVDYATLSGRTGPSITLADGQRTSSGVEVDILPDPTYGRIYRVTRGGLGGDRRSVKRNLGLFAQDRVRLGDRVTLNVGLRYERERLEGTGGGFTFDGNLAPRVGFAWDPTGAGRIKILAHAGVYYARIPSNMAIYMFQGGGGRVLRADYFDSGLTEPVPDGVEALDTTQHLLLSGVRQAIVDPHTRLGYVREGGVGVELEARPGLAVGARYLYRDMPRIVEDIGTAAMAMYFTAEPGFESVEYFVTNPHDGFPETVNGVGAFEDPVHRYQALELTLDRRFSGRWSLLASYRYSRLRGNYEGYYRNDTGRSAPAMSGLFDFPTDDPSYTEVGGALYGFRGDVRFLGESGPLPLDRPHELKAYASFVFDGGLGLGLGLRASSGRPLTPMAANPVYNRAGDIPEAPRGSGIETEDGFKTRTPFEWALDLHGDRAFAVGGGRLRLVLDVFNLFDARRVTDYDQNTELRFRVANPDFGRRTAYQEPRTIRLGLRFEL